MSEMQAGAVVLPSIRMARFQHAVNDITGDLTMTRRIMEAVEEHVESGSYRWGNACPYDGCGTVLEWRNTSGHVCPVHGYLGHMAATVLLIGFRPCTAASGSSDGES